MMTLGQRITRDVGLLYKLDIYEPYIQDFINDNQVCFFERYGGYWVFQEPDVYKKMLEIEKDLNCTVYAITHEFTSFGECYSFLYVSRYKNEWPYSLVTENGVHYATAYHRCYADFTDSIHIVFFVIMSGYGSVPPKSYHFH